MRHKRWLGCGLSVAKETTCYQSAKLFPNEDGEGFPMQRKEKVSLERQRQVGRQVGSWSRWREGLSAKAWKQVGQQEFLGVEGREGWQGGCRQARECALSPEDQGQ